MAHCTGADRSLSAKDARWLAQQTTELVEDQLKQIFPKIRSAASAGHTRVTVASLRGSYPEQQKVINALEALGYTVKRGSDQSEGKSWTSISWKN